MNGWRVFEMEKPKCGKCGKETTFLGYSPIDQKEFCITCYTKALELNGKSDGMTSPTLIGKPESKG